MPELDAEHRDQIAEALCAALDGRCPGCLPIADAVLPLVAGWLADAWDAGYEAGYDTAIFEQRGLSTDSDAHEFPIRNPYRGGDDD